MGVGSAHTRFSASPLLALRRLCLHATRQQASFACMFFLLLLLLMLELVVVVVVV